MGLRIEVDKSASNAHYHFVVKSAVGQAIVLSQQYSSKSACTKGLQSVIKNAEFERTYDVHECKNGRFHFNLKAKNGQVIGSSMMYTTMNSVNSVINTLQQELPKAQIHYNR